MDYKKTNLASSVRAITADTYGVAEEVPSKVNVHLSLRANVAWVYKIHNILFDSVQRVHELSIFGELLQLNKP